MSQTIEIVISPSGAVRVETKGFVGSQCRNATRALEEAIGARHSENIIPEFFAVSPITANVRSHR